MIRRLSSILIALLLVGCTSSQTAVPAIGALREAMTGVRANETLTGTTETMRGECRPPHDATKFTASGTTQGPFPGAFTATGVFAAKGVSLTSFEETFTITSGRDTIAGSMAWTGGAVVARCGGYVDRSTNFTYDATLTRGSFTKHFSGPASIANRIASDVFGETFDGM